MGELKRVILARVRDGEAIVVGVEDPAGVHRGAHVDVEVAGGILRVDGLEPAAHVADPPIAQGADDVQVDVVLAPGAVLVTGAGVVLRGVGHWRLPLSIPVAQVLKQKVGSGFVRKILSQTLYPLSVERGDDWGLGWAGSGLPVAGVGQGQESREEGECVCLHFSCFLGGTFSSSVLQTSARFFYIRGCCYLGERT